MGLLSDSDVGKKVFDNEDNVLGKITDIDDGGATVESDPKTDPDTLEPHGWDVASENRLPHDKVHEVEDTGVYVKPG